MNVTNLATGVAGMTSNAFLVDGAEVALVDVGVGFDLVEALERRGTADPTRVVLTHTHPDHVGNVEAVTAAYDVSVRGYDADAPHVDAPLEDGESVVLGDHTYEAWHTPGHAPDHLCLYSDGAGVLFSGDLIFPNGGVGRTDLPGCDHDALVESVRRVLDGTGPSLRGLYAGHGPAVETDPYRHVEAAADLVGAR